MGISFFTIAGDGVLDVPTENPASMGGFSEPWANLFGASGRPPLRPNQERGSCRKVTVMAKTCS